MKLWSKGLGRQILPFDLREATGVKEENDSILIEGRIVERKVNWPYKLHLNAEDMVNFTELMAKNEIILAYLKREYGWGFITFILKRLLLLPLVTLKVLFLKVTGANRSQQLISTGKAGQGTNKEGG